MGILNKEAYEAVHNKFNEESFLEHVLKA